MKIHEIITYITRLKVLENRDLKTLSFYWFFISLFPIQGVQQCWMIVDKLCSDEIIKRKFEDIIEKVEEQNQKIKSLEDIPSGIEEIAWTIKYNDIINQKVEELVNTLISENSQDSEWIMETTNWSYQSMLDSIVVADKVDIISTNNSKNTIVDSTITSKRTHLFSDWSSSNFIDGTSFPWNWWMVSMDGITTSWNITVEWSSVWFWNWGGITFWSNPNTVSWNCPKCKNVISVNETKLKGYDKIICPHCKEIFPYSIS